MKLLEAINNITQDNVHQINSCIQNRLLWLEMREPESDGTVYEQWEEKYDEWNDIAEKSEELLESYLSDSGMDAKELTTELQNMIQDFQLLYGGLSKLKL